MRDLHSVSGAENPGDAETAGHRETPRVDDIPRSSKLPRITDGPGSHDTARPLVRSERSPAESGPLRRRAAAWAPFVLGAAGAAFLVRGWFLSPAEPVESKEKPLQVALAAHLAAFDQGVSLGDWEQAVLALDRASRVSPRDPGVLLARAKLAVEQADAAWLVRKATPAAPTDGANFEDFVRGAGEARALAEEALRATPQSDDARRVLVSALRIFGEEDRARQVAAGLRDQSSTESVFALAALDLISSDVPPESAASRLRQSVWVSGLPGKGRATLVYALVRAGDIDGARVELDKLALLARPHPAAAALRALVDDARSTAKPVTAIPRRAKKSMAKLCPEDLKASSHDPHSVAHEAAIARCRGDITTARDLYQSILDASPTDPEALTGMGDLERHEDNWDAARNFYAEALRANPAFLPAAIGAADVEWEVGNLPVAQRKYREILEAFPNATHPPRVQERATPARGSKASG